MSQTWSLPRTGICTRSDTAPSKSSLLKAKITKIFWKWNQSHNTINWYPNLNVHLNHSLSNEGGAEKSPKWDKEMTTCYACQVEQRIGDAGGGNRDKYWITKRERSHLAAARMPKKPTRSTNCWMPYLARSNLYSASSWRWICFKGHQNILMVTAQKRSSSKFT